MLPSQLSETPLSFQIIKKKKKKWHERGNCVRGGEGKK